MRVHEAQRLAARILTKAKRDSPALSARLLLAKVLATDRSGLLLKSEEVLDRKQGKAFFALVRRRSRGEPLAYILGSREFYGLDFQVNASTLIPRPETEHIIECVLAQESTERRLCFADLGTGSGNLGITLAYLCPNWRGLLIDISASALAQAKANTARHGLEKRLTCLRADLGSLPLAQQCLDVLVANPPYIAHEEKDLVMDEVLNFEPHLALFADNHGLAQLQAAIDEASHHLLPGGRIYLEHGAEQGEAVRNLLQKNFTEVSTIRDLAGHERVSFGRLKKNSLILTKK